MPASGKLTLTLTLTLTRTLITLTRTLITLSPNPNNPNQGLPTSGWRDGGEGAAQLQRCGVGSVLARTREI